MALAAEYIFPRRYLPRHHVKSYIHSEWRFYIGTVQYFEMCDWSLRSALKGPDNQRFNTNTTASICLYSNENLLFFTIGSCKSSFPICSQMKQSFQSIVSSDVDNSSIDITLIFAMSNYPVHARLHSCYSISKMMKN